MFTETSRRCGGFRRKRNKIFQIVNAVWENATPCKNRLVESVAGYFFREFSISFCRWYKLQSTQIAKQNTLARNNETVAEKKVEKDVIQ